MLVRVCVGASGPPGRGGRPLDATASAASRIVSIIVIAARNGFGVPFAMSKPDR